MANGEIKIIQENSWGSFDERTVQAESGKVLGFDSGLNPIMVTSSGGSGKQNKFSILQVAHGFIVGSTIRSGGAGTFVGAQADTAENAEVIARVTEVADVDNFTAVTGGIIETGVPVADFGTVFFLDPDVAGGVTTVDPMDTGIDGTVSKPLLTVLKSGEIALFQNMRGVVVGGGSGGSGGLTANELAGIQGANALSAANPAATMADVGGGSAPSLIVYDSSNNFVHPEYFGELTPNFYFQSNGVVYGPYKQTMAFINYMTTNGNTSFIFPQEVVLHSVFPNFSASVTSISYPNLVYSNVPIWPGTITSVTTLSVPNLKVYVGTLSIGITSASLTTVNLDSLEISTQTISFNTCTSLTTLSLPRFYQGGLNLSGNTVLQSLYLPLWKYVISLSLSGSQTALTTLNLPSIIHCLSNLTITAGHTALTDFSMGSTLKYFTGNFVWTGGVLNQASIDNILVRLAALDGTNDTTVYSSKTVTLTGGTQATPSATGLAAKAILAGRGCTVTHN